MPIKLPKPRFRLRTLVGLIALLALGLWAGLNAWSPTRRLSRLVQPDQPAYIRREAASALGHQIPPWEVEQAVGILIGVLDDPSPRVREYAALGLEQLGHRAERAIPKLLALLDDKDRFVRCMAAAALGSIVRPDSEKRTQVITPLMHTLDDPDANVRLAAAGALTKLGETSKAAGTLVAALLGPDEYFRAQARRIMSRPGTDPRPLMAGLVLALRDRDERRREDAALILMQIAAPEALKSALRSAAEAEDVGVRRWAKGRLERLDSTP